MNEPTNVNTPDTLPDQTSPTSAAAHLRRCGGRWSLIVAVIVVICLALAGLAPGIIPTRTSEAWTPLLEWHEGQILGTARLVRNWGDDDGQPITLPSTGPAELAARQWLVFPTVSESGALRITVDVEWIDNIDAVEMALHAAPDPTPVWWMVPRGITGQFGGDRGAETTLSFNYEADRPSNQGLRTWPFEPGRRYRLRLESVDGMARMSVDGQTVLELAELLPVSAAGSEQISLRFWAPVRLHALQVERRRISDAVSPIVTGDVLAEAGDIREAIRWYLQVADDHAESPLEALALMKAAACAGTLAGESAALARIQQRLENDNVPQSFRDQVDSVICLQRWRIGKHREALDLATALQAHDPETRIALHLLAQRRGRIPAPQGRRLAVLAAKTPGQSHLDLTGLDLTDLDFLSGLSLVDLDASSNPLTDINALHGLPLKRLRLADTDVSDITALAGMPLESLSLTNCPITDLAGLRGAHFRELDLSQTAITDCSPLAGMPLRRLSLARTAVSDVSSLAGMPIESLSLAGLAVVDLEPLRGAPITNADISDSQVHDCSALAGPALRNLQAARSQLSDIGPLAAATALEEVNIAGTAVSDLSALKGLPIRALNCSHTAVRDLSGIPVNALETVNIAGTLIREVETLRFAPLRRFSARGSALTSIRPLLDCPLQDVDLVDSKATDFSLLVQVATLQVASITGILATAEDWQAAERFCAESGRSDLALACRVAAVEDHDPAALAALAQEDHDGVRRLRLGRRYDPAAARALADASGAVLAWPRDARDFRSLMTLVDLQGEIWTDLRLVDGVPVGPNNQTLLGIPGDFARNHEAYPVHLFWSGGDRGVSRADPTRNGSGKYVVLQWGAATPP